MDNVTISAKRFVKQTLICVIIAFLFISCLQLVLSRPLITQFVSDNESNRTNHSESLLDNGLEVINRLDNSELVSAIISTMIIFESLFAIVCLYLVVREIFAGVLAVNIIALVCFLYGVFVTYPQIIGHTLLDMTLAMIQIILSFIFSYQIRPTAQDCHYSAANLRDHA